MSKPNNSTSSPPPPKNSPPPPSPSSSPPPPSPSPPSQSPPPPSDKGSPPPPSDKGSPPPPSSNNDNKSSPPPPSDNKNDYNYKSPPPPPKSNSGSSNNGYSNSPSPPTSYSSTKSLPNSSSNENSSSFSSTVSQNVMLIGLAAGAGLLLLILAIFLISCSSRRKRKPRDNRHYYSDNSQGHTTNDYYQNSGAWANNAPRPSHDYRMPPSAQVSSEYDWPVKPPPPPPPMLMSAEMGSRNSSGSLRHGLAPPPLHPQVSNIGYNQSSFTYDDLASATGGFASTNLLGQGGFGYVHKGVLPNGKEVAVKSLKANSGQGEREFQAEVDIISRVHHRHLVSLVGYCIAGNQRMLVYEFVANDTLESYLHGKVKQPMNWQTRHTIAVGSAKGFAYLHEDCHPRIIHRDIKASNILIDENFEAKVADFGLAKLSNDNNTHVSTRIMGTFGYLAPEYAASGKLSEKSDVYSFGVVLLELITGKRPIDVHSDEDSLVDWARPILTSALDGECGYEELADPLLEGNYDPQEMQRMIACASACIRHSARRRPKMSQVVRALEGDGSLSDLDEGGKPNQQISTSSSEFDLRKMKKTGLSSQEFSSNEFGTTGEFAHSSGGESREMSSSRRDNVGRLV